MFSEDKTDGISFVGAIFTSKISLTFTIYSLSGKKNSRIIIGELQKVLAFADMSVHQSVRMSRRSRVIFGVRFERRKVDKNANLHKN